MAKLSDEQRRVLKILRKSPSCAKDMKTGVRTMIALSRRKLIYVATTFESVAFPQKARAEITEAGRAAIFTLNQR